MSAAEEERVLSVLQGLLPADTAAALHEHARELMQRRARAASDPVHEALRARVAALESQAVELADAIQKQRGDAPEWASQRLDEEQRRALSALLTALCNQLLGCFNSNRSITAISICPDRRAKRFI